MELAFSPQGRLIPLWAQAGQASAGQAPGQPTASGAPGGDTRWAAAVAKAFEAGQAQGLFALAAERIPGPVSPSVA